MLVKATAYSLIGCGFFCQLAEITEPTWDKLGAIGLLATFLGLWLSGRILSVGEHNAQMGQMKKLFDEMKEAMALTVEATRKSAETAATKAQEEVNKAILRAEKWERMFLEERHNAVLAERTTETSLGVAETSLKEVEKRKPRPPPRGESPPRGSEE